MNSFFAAQSQDFCDEFHHFLPAKEMAAAPAATPVVNPVTRTVPWQWVGLSINGKFMEIGSGMNDILSEMGYTWSTQ
jgi:hypothetical protein